MLFNKLFGNKTGGSTQKEVGEREKAEPSLREQQDLARRIIHSNDSENMNLAEVILLKCVENNIKGASRDLGLLYAKSPDSELRKRGHEMLTEAHDGGDISATVDLGLCWFKGYFGKRDYEKAMEFYGEAANRGHENAAFNLGAMFLTGEGANIDFYKARDWFKVADGLGNRVAKKNLEYVNEGISIFEEEAALAAAFGKKYFPNLPDRGKALQVLDQIESTIDNNPELEQSLSTVAMGLGVSIAAYKSTQDALVLMRNLAFYTGIPYERILDTFIGDDSAELRDFILSIE